MTRQEFLRALAGGVILALLSGCQPGDPRSSHMYFDPIRYRLAVEIETPQGLHTGSSVIQTVWDRGLLGAVVTGEAVAVDLPNGQTVFVLLRSSTNPDWASQVPGVMPPASTEPLLTAEARQADVRRQVKWILANRDVHFLWGDGVPKERAQYLPHMVRFRDIRDPKSVEQVDPVAFDKSFGAGVKLKQITVQVTDAPVTIGIQKRLAWLSEIGRQRATLIPDPPRLLKDATAIQLIAPSDFSTELYK